jgi:hypothetical protein
MVQIARLAARGLADELCRLNRPEPMLDRIEALEAW